MAIFKKGGEYYIDYYVRGRRKREKVGPSKKLAEAVLNKRKVEIAENKFLNISKEERIKFKDFAQTYLELHAKPNKKSWASTDRHYLKKLIPYFGDQFLHEISPLLIERYKAERAKEVSSAYVNRELTCLKGMFSRAMDWDMAKENPAKKVKLFKENNKRTRYLEKEEILELLSHSSLKLRSIVILAVNTGMRKSEIQNLKWSDINFQQGFLTLHETKNGEERKVPMNRAVRRVFLSVKKNPESPYVFCGRDGSPFNFRKSFETALAKSDIKDFRFHDLRHTFASHLAMAGVDLNTIRELLGHKSMAMVLRYAHLSKDHKARAVATLDNGMDTIWTPNVKSQEGSELDDFINQLETETNELCGPVAQR